MCKENEGKSKTIISEESEGKICKTLSNWSYQLPQEGTLCCCISKIFKKTQIDERILILKDNAKKSQIVENIKEC